MSNPSGNAKFFPSIGLVADQTDLYDNGAENVPKEEVEEDDNEERPLQEVDSLCMSCGEQGVTRMLLTSIPFFREVIVMSFECDHCGNRNNECQSAGIIREHGTMYTAKILTRGDLNRQLVKSATCTVTIPEFELTIPAQRGQLTTVEGLLQDTAKDLSIGQPLRRLQDEAVYKKIQDIIDAFKEITGDDEDEEEEESTAKGSKQLKPIRSFTVQLDDPAGDSFIEFIGSMNDPKWNLRTYARNKEQNIALGLLAPDEAEVEKQKAVEKVSKEDMALVDQMEAEEIFVFPGVCSSCSRSLDTLMKKISIPYFKDILIMSTNCEYCGYKDNEVKSGSAVSKKGARITLKVQRQEDLSRDVLKSETCGVSIPEIELVLQPGTLGGRFTTVEGILEQVYTDLNEKVFSDSSTGDDAFVQFLEKLKKAKAAEIPFTFILDDPMANSYLQSLYAPDPDPNMEVGSYERTWEQNEELGLNDMVTEGYEEAHAIEMEKLRLEKAKGQENGKEKEETEQAKEDDAFRITKITPMDI